VAVLVPLFCMAHHGKYLSCLALPAHRTAASMSTKLQALFLTAMAVEFILRFPRSSLPNESMISSIADRSNHSLERTAARRVFAFYMIKTISLAGTLALGGGRSAFSR